MKSIWKYQIPLEDKFSLEIHEGARILALQTQEDRPCIWCLVDNMKPRHVRHFETYGTGHVITGAALDPGSQYIGTYQVRSIGTLVFHVFEVQKQ